MFYKCFPVKAHTTKEEQHIAYTLHGEKRQFVVRINNTNYFSTNKREKQISSFKDNFYRRNIFHTIMEGAFLRNKLD